ncbi:LOW QUALITY PROTEIN: hypothetical protein HID58_062610, partial [Brassica napus]
WEQEIEQKKAELRTSETVPRGVEDGESHGGSAGVLVSSRHIVPGHLEDSSIANKSLPRRESVRRLGFVRTLLIDNYDSYTFNIHQALSTINGVPPVVIWNCEWTSYCYFYEDTASDTIVILPGPGICLGHQRLCGACPGTSPWMVKAVRYATHHDGTYCFLVFHPGETLISRQVIYYFSHKLKHKVIQRFSGGVGMFNG